VVIVAAVALLAEASFGQSSLPPEVQADIVKVKIIDAAKRSDLRAVLAGIDEINALKVPVAPSLRFLEAKAASQSGDSVRALKALEQFLAASERTGPQYAEALALYPKYQAAGVAAQQELRERRPSELRAAGQGEVADLIERLQAEMIDVRAGSFRMGGQSGSYIPDDEKPVHEVTLRAFRLGKYEVTFEQYDVFAKATGRALPDDKGWGREKRPVINVSWDDAKAFAAWLSEQSGQKYRLPSEAEWEFAARAGTTTENPWGSAFSAEQANGMGTSGRDTYANTAPVGSFPANAWGLYDVIGNVWEWTEDCWNGSYTGAPVDGSPWTTGDCSRRVIRGGSWNNDPADLRVSNRAGLGPTSRDVFRGFRLAQDP